MIGIAKEKAKTQGIKNVLFTTATIEDWHANDHSYDVILGLSILHLLEDKEAVLAKVHWLLKPGGIFVSSTVCMAELPGLMRWLLPVGNALGILPLVRTFSADELMESMQRSGFSVESNWCPKSGSSVFIVAKPATI
jgi:2-polyprenyl-3-methyl-5-hydroxy-6-metoxy-1,4-benzoquinol methylase